jgi:acyl-CoA reductase-like NAD-dependent aldehyde dehydrogenase
MAHFKHVFKNIKHLFNLGAADVTATIVRDIDDGASRVDEEKFGPILPIIKFSGVDDALVDSARQPTSVGSLNLWPSVSK